MRPELSSSRFSPGTVSVQAFNIPGASWPWAEAIFGLILLVAALVALLGWTEKRRLLKRRGRFDTTKMYRAFPSKPWFNPGVSGRAFWLLDREIENQL